MAVTTFEHLQIASRQMDIRQLVHCVVQMNQVANTIMSLHVLFVLLIGLST